MEADPKKEKRKKRLYYISLDILNFFIILRFKILFGTHHKASERKGFNF